MRFLGSAARPIGSVLILAGTVILAMTVAVASSGSHVRGADPVTFSRATPGGELPATRPDREAGSLPVIRTRALSNPVPLAKPIDRAAPPFGRSILWPT